jgi:hypothetical protein
MRRGLLLALLGLTLATGSDVTGLSTPPSREAPWLTDLDQARAEARQGGKPIFVVFR